MASPTPQATNVSDEFAANVTSHTVSLPADISSGDLLVVAFGCHGVENITWPEGWTEIFNITEAGGATGTLAAAYRQADGEEGASITVGTGNVQQSGHCSWRITGHENPAIQAPEASTGATSASGGTPCLLYTSPSPRDRS